MLWVLCDSVVGLCRNERQVATPLGVAHMLEAGAALYGWIVTAGADRNFCYE